MNCPLCGRSMNDCKNIDKHHLVPKMHGGKETYLIHRICHSKIHSVFSEAELAKIYNTFEKLKEHDEIRKFIKWVRTKPNDYYSSNRETTTRKSKRW